MKYSQTITAAALMTALIPGAQIYAHQGHASHAIGPVNAQNQGRPAPELFDDFGVTQTANKILPATAIEGRSRSVKVNSDLLWSDVLTLTLFDGEVFTAVRDRLIEKVKGSSTWIGHIEGEEETSEVFLTVRGRVMVGTIRIGNDLYEVRYVGNDLHEINQVDPGKNPQGHKERIAEVQETDLQSSTTTDTQVVRDLAANGTVVDVMVVYTGKARNNAGGQSGMEAKIDNAVAMANQAYLNSNVDMQLNLVHTAEVSYVENGDILASHDALTYKTDGKMDEIHGMRDQYGADMVVLISTDSNACGVAWTMTSPSSSFESRAFAVVKDTCISQHSFAHELGHIQGNMHDKANSSRAGAYDYSYGYRLCVSGGFRTVMSYSCSGGTRVGYFSNPNVIYNGEYTGTSTEDNARSMTNTKSIVAAWRASTTVDNTIPVAPSNLSAVAMSDSEIALDWSDNSGNETGFRLERSVDGVNWYEVAVVGSDMTSFTDNGLLAETTYQYRVRAYNSNGNSSYSNIGSATTDAVVVETCVTNTPLLSIAPETVYTAAGATIHYSVALSNQDSAVCGVTTFTVTTSDGTTLGSYALSAGSSANATWTTTAPLTDGSMTKSVTATATAHASVTQYATVYVDATAPSAPSNLTAAEQRKNQVVVSWGASSDTGSGFDHYVVKRDNQEIAVTTSIKITDKPDAGTHTYTVVAYDKVGNQQGSSTSITLGSSSTSKGNGRSKDRK